MRRRAGNTLMVSRGAGLSTDAGVGFFELLGAVCGVSASGGNSEDGGKNAAVHGQSPFLLWSHDHATAALHQIACITSEYLPNQ